MPDISMCSNKECPSKETCYRFRAKPNDWQSYAAFKPDGDKCDRFISIEGYEEYQLTPTAK